MAVEKQVTVTIDAPPERVWEVMAGIERWPEWTKSITSVERLTNGPFGVGTRAKLKQPRLPAMEWTVTDCDPGRSFTWQATAPGTVTAAVHIITSNGNGGSTVTLKLRQSGFLGSIFSPLFAGMTSKYIQMEAEGLKARSEGRL